MGGLRGVVLRRRAGWVASWGGDTAAVSLPPVTWHNLVIKTVDSPD